MHQSMIHPHPQLGSCDLLGHRPSPLFSPGLVHRTPFIRQRCRYISHFAAPILAYRGIRTFLAKSGTGRDPRHQSTLTTRGCDSERRRKGTIPLERQSHRAGHCAADPNRAEPNRAEPNRAEPNRPCHETCSNASPISSRTSPRRINMERGKRTVSLESPLLVSISR